jgi:hypothetical protein
MEMNEQFHAPVVLPLWTGSQYTFIRILCGLQSRCGPVEKRKIFAPVGNRTLVPQSYSSWPNEYNDWGVPQQVMYFAVDWLCLRSILWVCKLSRALTRRAARVEGSVGLTAQARVQNVYISICSRFLCVSDLGTRPPLFSRSLCRQFNGWRVTLLG